MTEKKKTVKVSLLEKPGGKNKKILYLNFTPAIIDPTTGKPTRREFPGISIYEKPRNDRETAHNKAAREAAEKIRATRQLQIIKGEYGKSLEKQDADFVAYFKELADQRKGSNSDNWISAYHYLTDFTGGQPVRFADLDLQFCEDFRQHLFSAPTNRSGKTTLAQNSVVSYFNKLKAALKQAYKDGFLTTDLNARVGNVKQAETHRQFLSLEELQKLANTDCDDPTLKQAYKDGFLTTDLNARVGNVKQAETHRQFLSLEELQNLANTDCDDPTLKRAAIFSALTGLRFSDIQKLTWGEVQQSTESGYFLQFKQKKTGGAETLPIGIQAAEIMGERGKLDEPVFKGLVYSAWQNLKLKRWVLQAGIFKEITFHSFRHTYATLQLTLGTDIYTVSKMLGHKDLKTTMIYGKIVDEKKRDAANKIKLDL